MLQMYGHVLHEKRKQFALSSTTNKLPHVGQNNSIMKQPQLIPKNSMHNFVMYEFQLVHR